MALPNIFTKPVADEIIARINKLTPSTPAKWGKMNVSQMLAHCNVTYEMIYENIHPAPKGMLKLMLRLFVKKIVVGEKPYGPGKPTAPAFIIKTDKDFDREKKRLIDHIIKTQQAGEQAFHNKHSLSFGPLTSTEWNNMFYKHLNHHLSQFGV